MKNRCHASAAIFLSACLLSAASAASAAADPVEDFYKGRSITLTIGTDAGGGYDQYARTLARNMGRFIPGNPTIIPKNMPGADGIQAANRIYSIAPRDGSEIGSFHRDIPILPLLGAMKIPFDGHELSWIGSMNKETAVCMAWHTTGIKRFEDTFTKQLIVGNTAAGAALDSFEPPLMNLFGAKFKVISGYVGGQNVDLAMEKGEIEGRCGVSWSSLVARNASWFQEKKVNFFVQLGLEKHPDLPDVPMIQDYAKTQADRDALNLLLIPGLIGRPFLAPPRIPAERLAALRSAFNATLKDEAFLADAKKQRMEVQLVTGEEVAKVIDSAYASPPAVIQRAKEAMAGAVY